MNTNIKLRKIDFLMSTLNPADEKLPDLPYIVFAGRSNVGKSSLLNHILGRKISFVSKTPGRTKTINLFVVNDGLVIVDLPGYGYAKVSKKERKLWHQSLTDFLYHPNIRGGFLLVDIRHEPTANDLILRELFLSIPINYRTVLTKADKLSNNKKHNMVNSITKILQIPKDEIILSSIKKQDTKGIIWNALLTLLYEDDKKILF